MDNSGQPIFSKDVYRRWIKRKLGSEKQQKRYREVVKWYDAHPELEVDDKKVKPSKNGSKLALILAELLEQALSKPGIATRRQLAGGLRVDVLVNDQITHLQLSRDGVFPSETEWKTTLKNWPYLVYADPERKEHQGRYFLSANWKMTQV